MLDYGHMCNKVLNINMIYDIFQRKLYNTKSYFTDAI